MYLLITNSLTFITEQNWVNFPYSLHREKVTSQQNKYLPMLDLDVIIVGYAATTLYAEAETKIFLANESEDAVTYMYLEEVKIFLKDANNTHNYFKLHPASGVIGVTANKHEASLFTLATTPQLHSAGQFQIVYTPPLIDEDNTTAEVSTKQTIVMEDDITKEHHSLDGPYRLISDESDFAYDIHGISTTLPEFRS